MSLKGFLCVCYATVALAAGQKTWAQETPDAVQGTLVACLSGQASTADGKDALIALGWQPVERADLSDRAVLGHAARNLVLHLSGMQASQRWASEWEHTRSNATGVRRLTSLPIDGFSFQTYQRENDPSLLEVMDDARGNLRRKTCQFVLSLETGRTLAASLPAPSKLPTPIHTFPIRNLPGGTLQVSAYDSSRIESAIGEEFPFLAYISVVSQ